MLAEAQRLRAQGLDILIGVAETHGRKGTAAMLQGLSTLPPRRLAHRGRYVYEFDLDAALARRPALILVDELAHSNAPGSRHPKRWQDVDELLEAGIDVFTTVNVQHLESLNDVVSGITGVQVRETVPDPSLTPRTTWCWWTSPDDLRQRLNEGKVYIGGQAERAIENFFRKGNLIALRELALRRTADRVDEQMRAWRDRQGAGEKVWHTRDAILLCIGHNTGSESWCAPPPGSPPRPGQRLACGVCRDPFPAPATGRPAAGYSRRAASGPGAGAETATLSDPSEEKAVLHYAREHNLGKIVIGRQSKRRWWDRSGFADRLARHAPDLDLVVIALDEKPFPLAARASDSRPALEKWRLQLQGCAVAVALCAIITLVAMQWLMAFEAANLVMLYLLGW